jgi:hypothetical protein
VNNSGDISWHKNRVFISEIFRFEELAFELITPWFYRVFFRDMEIGELNVKIFVLELHGEWSEFAAEYDHSATPDTFMSPTNAT